MIVDKSEYSFVYLLVVESRSPAPIGTGFELTVGQQEKTAGKKRQADAVERAYDQVKELAIRYRIRPGDRVKESELAQRLNLSRTPLREALNRLVSEGFMSFVPNRGFCCREIDTKEVVDLYETRAALEFWAFRLACQRASDEAIETACAIWEACEPRPKDISIRKLAESDEKFHMAVAELSGNSQLVQSLDVINARIRFFREIDLENRERSGMTSIEHQDIIEALKARDAAYGPELIAQHVQMSADHAIDVTKEGLARIYLGAA